MVSGFCSNSRNNLHVENLYGENNHHIVESVLKVLQELSKAITIDQKEKMRFLQLKDSLKREMQTFLYLPKKSIQLR